MQPLSAVCCWSTKTPRPATEPAVALSMTTPLPFWSSQTQTWHGMQSAVLRMPASASSGFDGLPAGALQSSPSRPDIFEAIARARRLRAASRALRERARTLRTTAAHGCRHARDRLAVRRVLILARLRRVRALLAGPVRPSTVPRAPRRVRPPVTRELTLPSTGAAIIRRWPPLAIIPPDLLLAA